MPTGMRSASPPAIPKRSNWGKIGILSTHSDRPASSKVPINTALNMLLRHMKAMG